MHMNCQPIPTLDERINDIRMRTAQIVNEDILPNEAVLWARDRDAADDSESWTRRTERLELRAGRACGRRTSPRSTAGWASTSSPTPT